MKEEEKYIPGKDSAPFEVSFNEGLLKFGKTEEQFCDKCGRSMIDKNGFLSIALSVSIKAENTENLAETIRMSINALNIKYGKTSVAICYYCWLKAMNIIPEENL